MSLPTLLQSQVAAARFDSIRIDRRKNAGRQYAIYFHCQTTLIETFRALFPATFKFEGNRGIVFDEGDRIPVDELRLCIEMALTYHQKKRPTLQR